MARAIRARRRGGPARAGGRAHPAPPLRRGVVADGRPGRVRRAHDPSTADDLIDAFQAAFSGRARNAFAACCAVDVHYEDPLTGGALHGLDAARRPRRAAVDDAARRAGPARGRAADRRALRRRARGSWWAPTAATCRACPPAAARCRCTASSTASWRPTRDRLWRVRAFFDAYDAAVQLGVLPRHGTLGERALMLLRGFGLRSTDGRAAHAARARRAAGDHVGPDRGQPLVHHAAAQRGGRRVRRLARRRPGCSSPRSRAATSSASRCSCRSATCSSAAPDHPRAVGTALAAPRARWRPRSRG